MRSRRARRLAITAAGVSVAAETLVVARRRGSLLRARTPVRCASGHLFTTVWLPGASVKALRFGWWRFQRCPVGGHWSVVSPVRASKLSASQRSEAASTMDTWIP